MFVALHNHRPQHRHRHHLYAKTKILFALVCPPSCAKQLALEPTSKRSVQNYAGSADLVTDMAINARRRGVSRKQCPRAGWGVIRTSSGAAVVPSHFTIYDECFVASLALDYVPYQPVRSGKENPEAVANGAKVDQFLQCCIHVRRDNASSAEHHLNRAD